MKPKEPDATVVTLGSAILAPLPGESSPSAPGGLPLDGELIDGRYALERELGRGGMGVVYQGMDVTLGRPVAVKLVHPEMLAQPAIAALFRQEARALASLRSEHVVGVYALGTHHGSFFFSMELVEGESLESLLAAHRASGEPIPVHRALVILRSIAAGLDEVHRAGLLHRDIKPDNVIIERRTGRPVLIDFGLATATTSGGGAFRVAGTPGYMAPELFAGAAPTSAGDVYAFACTAFELLTTRTVFDAPTSDDLVRRHALVEAPLLSSLRDELAPADAIMAAALAKKPAVRPTTCGALADALADALRPQVHAERVFGGSVPPPPSVDPGMHALVVDDDPDFARLAARAVALAFQGTPAKVVLAHDGVRGLELATWKMPRLLLLDFDMPTMDGCEMLSRLRALPGSAACRVVVLSAAGARLPRHRFQLLGVEDILPKPVPFPRLLAMVQEIADREQIPTSVAPARARRGAPSPR